MKFRCNIKQYLMAFILSLFCINISASDLDTEHIKNWIQDTGCKVSEKQIDLIVDNVLIKSRQNNVDPYLVFGLIKQESCYNTNAKSFADAKGLTQVIPKWHQNKIRGRNLHNPEVGIEVGIKVLREYLDASRGNLKNALAKYSGGATRYYQKVTYYRDDLKKYVKENKEELFASNQIYYFDQTKVNPIEETIEVLPVSFKNDFNKIIKTNMNKNKEQFDLLGFMIASL